MSKPTADPCAVAWTLDTARLGWNEAPNAQPFVRPIVLDERRGVIVGRGYVQSAAVEKATGERT